MKQTIQEKLALPAGVTITADTTTLSVKGPKGTVTRTIAIPGITITITDKEFTITAKNASKREKKRLYTTLAHTKNMIHGVQQPYKYTLKICSGHFPMNVSIANNTIIVKNFLGEKYPRTMPLKQGVTVTVQGDKINIESPDKELTGTTASDIELLTFISKRDTRIFQDGIYLIEKDGETLA